MTTLEGSHILYDVRSYKGTRNSRHARSLCGFHTTWHSHPECERSRTSESWAGLHVGVCIPRYLAVACSLYPVETWPDVCTYCKDRTEPGSGACSTVGSYCTSYTASSLCILYSLLYYSIPTYLPTNSSRAGGSMDNVVIID